LSPFGTTIGAEFIEGINKQVDVLIKSITDLKPKNSWGYLKIVGG